jgi:hypothetical protein
MKGISIQQPLLSETALRQVRNRPPKRRRTKRHPASVRPAPQQAGMAFSVGEAVREYVLQISTPQPKSI